MNPIAPLQKKTIACIESVTNFPTVLADLVTQYTDDFEQAGERFQPTKDGRLIDYKKKAVVIDALISPRCDPLIKREIISHTIQGRYKPAMNQIFDEIRQQGYCLNFDLTDFSGLSLFDFNFSGMSAIGAKFVQCSMNNVNLSNADLTGAWLRNCVLISANLTEANLYKACIVDSDLTRATLVRTELTRAMLQNVTTGETVFDEITTDIEALQKILRAYSIKCEKGKKGKIRAILSLQVSA